MNIFNISDDIAPSVEFTITEPKFVFRKLNGIMLSCFIEPDYPIVLKLFLDFFETELCEPTIRNRDAVNFFYAQIIDCCNSSESIKIIADVLRFVLHSALVGKVE